MKFFRNIEERINQCRCINNLNTLDIKYLKTLNKYLEQRVEEVEKSNFRLFLSWLVYLSLTVIFSIIKYLL